MDASPGKAIIQILLNHPDKEKRFAFFAQWHENKHILEEALGESWYWERELAGSPHQSSISQSLEGVELLNKKDWPAIISFFKPRIIALDAFWNDMQMVFEK